MSSTQSASGRGVSYEIAQGMRAVLLGNDPDGVTLTRRARSTLDDLRENYTESVAADASVLALSSSGTGRWWTWAGTAANRTLHASLPDLVDPRQRIDEKSLRLLPGVTAGDVSDALGQVAWRSPVVAANAVSGLKFSAALPPGLAERTLAERLGDSAGARAVVDSPRTIYRSFE